MARPREACACARRCPTRSIRVAWVTGTTYVEYRAEIVELCAELYTRRLSEKRVSETCVVQCPAISQCARHRFRLFDQLLSDDRDAPNVLSMPDRVPSRC